MGIRGNKISCVLLQLNTSEAIPLNGKSAGCLHSQTSQVCNLNPLAVVTESLSCIPTLERGNELVQGHGARVPACEHKQATEGLM